MQFANFDATIVIRNLKIFNRKLEIFVLKTPPIEVFCWDTIRPWGGPAPILDPAAPPKLALIWN